MVTLYQEENGAFLRGTGKRRKIKNWVGRDEVSQRDIFIYRPSLRDEIYKKNCTPSILKTVHYFEKNETNRTLVELKKGETLKIIIESKVIVYLLF